MTTLTRWLYPLPADRRLGPIVRWWERRRLAYNCAVGATGALTLAVVTLVGHLPPSGHDFLPPLGAVLVYGVLANICYSFGWVIEGATELLFRGEIRPTGPVLFRQGLSFSIGLTLLPMGLALFDWGVRLLRFLW